MSTAAPGTWHLEIDDGVEIEELRNGSGEVVATIRHHDGGMFATALNTATGNWESLGPAFNEPEVKAWAEGVTGVLVMRST